MKKLFSNFVTWFKTPNPERILLKLCKPKSVRDKDKDIKIIKDTQQIEEYRRKIEKEAYFLWEAEGKPEGKDNHYWTLAIHKIRKEESSINKIKKILVNNCGQILVKGGTMLTILAAFGAFAITMRQREFDRFSLVKPVFEVEQLENKKFKLFNHHGIVFFIGCNQNYRYYKDDVLFDKLKTTPKQYSSLSKKKSLEFIFKEKIKIEDNNYFVCYYRDIDLNLYELQIVYKKNPDTNTNSSFYIHGTPLVYRSDLFVTVSRKWLWLDKIVSFIFPKDWYQVHKTLKHRFNECEEYKLDEIHQCLTVKYSNSAEMGRN